MPAEEELAGTVSMAGAGNRLPLAEECGNRTSRPEGGSGKICSSGDPSKPNSPRRSRREPAVDSQTSLTSRASTTTTSGRVRIAIVETFDLQGNYSLHRLAAGLFRRHRTGGALGAGVQRLTRQQSG